MILGNFNGSADDYLGMTCDEVREGLSARLDGEQTSAARGLDEHLADCAACRTWLATATALGRRARISGVTDSGYPELGGAGQDAFVAGVLKAALPELQAGAQRRARRERVVRNALAVAGGVLLFLVVVSLAGAARYVPEATHLTSTTAFWAALLGAGFVGVALAPSRSTTAAPFLATSASFLLVATIFDLAGRHVHVLHEVPTTVALAGMAAVVALAWPRREGLVG